MTASNLKLSDKNYELVPMFNATSEQIIQIKNIFNGKRKKSPVHHKKKK